MLKKINHIITISLLLLIHGFASADNIMLINSAQVQANQQVNIQIIITNTNPFVAFQLDVPLPSQFSYIANSAILNASRSNGHTLSATLLTGNILRIIGFSFSNTPFLGNSGVIASFTLNTATIPGDYTLTPTNAIIGNAASTNILSSVVSGTLTLQAPNINLNSVNFNFGQIPLGNTADQNVSISNTGNQNLIVSNITFNSPYFAVVGNTAITIPPNGSSTVLVRFTSTVKGNYQKTMTITSNDPDQPSSTLSLQAVAFAVNEIHCGSMSAFSGTQANLNFSINNMESFTGFQFDLQLPTALTYQQGSVLLSNRKTNHVVSANVLTGNILRVVAYSLNNQSFSGNSGDVVSMSFSVNGTGGSYALNLSNSVIGNTNAENIISAFYNNNLQIAAANIWSNNNLSFGTISVFDTAMQSLRINNYGNDTLKLNQLQFTNTAFFSNITLPIHVNHGEFIDIPVKMHTASEGQANGILKIFSNDPDESPKNISLSGNTYIPNYLSVIDTSCFKTDTVTVQIAAENYENFVGFQFDISFPATMTYVLNSVSLTNRSQGHNVQASLINSTTLRVVGFSMQQFPFLGNSGALVNLKFAVNVLGSENRLPLLLSNAILGNIQSQNILYGTHDGGVQIIQLNVSGQTNVCQGQSNVNYMVTAIPNATGYNWSLPSGASIIAGNNTNSITVSYSSAAISGNVSVNVMSATGNGTSNNFAVLVNPLPSNAGTISGLTTLCQGQGNITYTVPAIINATSYIWTLPSGATGTSTTNTISLNYGTSAVTGNISVTGNNLCGNGISSNLAIIVNPLTVGAGTIIGLANVCQEQSSVTYYVPVITNATTYIWTLPTGATGTSTTNTIAVNYGASVVSDYITVKGSNTCGDGTNSSLAITINPLPSNANSITGISTINQGQNNITYTVPSILNATSYIWSLPYGAIGSSSTNSITANYSTSAIPGNITVKGHNNCGDGVASSLVINVNPLPVDWEIFKNKTTYNFNALKTTDSIPDEVVKLTTLNTPDYATTKDRFSSRIKGYLIPPLSGNYSFYFAADNVGQFWLSPDTSSANAVLKSNITSIQTDWNQNISNQTLIAGNKYFFEILHYDTVYTDLIKLGWIIPGDTLPIVINTPYVTNCNDGVSVISLSLLDKQILAYPNWNINPRYKIFPWNASNKSVKWMSSNNAIATVNTSGVVHTVSQGICQIIAKVIEDTTLTDTLILTVSNYYGPYFVKPNSMGNGDGHTWDNAMDLPKLLDVLNQGQLSQILTIYAAEGNYKPTTTIDRNKTFSLNNIRLVGGFSLTSTGTDTTIRDFLNHATILSGEIGEQGNTIDNSYHVVIAINYVAIDGITIRDGRASCSTLGFNPSTAMFNIDNNGGGIYIGTTSNYAPAMRIDLTNCQITNNSAWNTGGGIYLTKHWTSQNVQLNLQNSSISNNLIQAEAYNANGGIFNIIFNGYGGGISMSGGSMYLNNCLLYSNTSLSRGTAIHLAGSAAIIKNSSIFNNGSGNLADIRVEYSSVNIFNSSVKGTIHCSDGTTNLTNSTIVGSLTSNSQNQYTSTIDNSIWTAVNFSQFTDTASLVIKNSILNNKLFGNNKYNIISDSVPNYTNWLDTLNFNGGITPTMKLKNVPNNFAKSYGNPLYLDSLDQRGVIRKDSVSIGAYQWVKPTNIAVFPKQITLCQGDSVSLNVSILPVNVNDSKYTITSLHDSIAHIIGLKIYAVSNGETNVIIRTVEKGLTDTCKVNVVGSIGIGVISGVATVCQGQSNLTYTTSLITNATSYNWTLPNGATGTSSTNSILVNFDSTAVSGSITVKGSNNCFEGVSSSLPIIVNPKPNLPIITDSVFYCLNTSSTALNAIGVDLLWYNSASGGSVSSTTPIPLTSDTGVTIYYVSQTVNGCESAKAQITSIVNPVYTYSESHSICNGSVYNWHGTNYTTSGTFTKTYTSINGCDSTYTLQLTVNPTYTFNESHSFCNGAIYNWKGTNYTTAGTFTKNYTSSNGCDSNYTLQLTFNPTYAYTETYNICNGGIYNWRGTNYTTSGTYTKNYPSFNGCDSIYTLQLTVNPTYAFTENHNICNGTNFMWHGISYTTPGTFIKTYTTVYGCDSIYTLNLSFNQTYTFNESHSICNGTTFYWKGTNYTTVGTYTKYYTSSNGCDSIYTLQLTVNPVYAYTENQNICNGANYNWHGTNYTTSGTFNKYYTSINGCDSIYTLNLIVNPTYAFTENYSICNGATYNWRGTNYTTAGTFIKNYTSSNGCDSIYTLQLTVNPTYAYTENHSICNGGTYNWRGTNYTIAGNYIKNYPSMNGCDSIYTLQLTVNPVYTYSESHSICNGTVYNWHGTNYTTSGTYTKAYTSINGCDSTYTLQLTVNTVNIGVTLFANTITVDSIADAYQWLNCDNGFTPITGEINQNFTATSNGNYAVRITRGLCIDTSICVNITNIGVVINENNQTLKVYPNPFKNELIIEIEGNFKNRNFKIYNSMGQLVFKGIYLERTIVQTSNFAKGVYLIKLENGDYIEYKKVVKD